MIQYSQPLEELEWIPRPKLTALRRLEIETVEDLLTHYPRRYEDRTHFAAFPREESDSPLLQAVKTACRMADSLGYAAVVCQSTASYADLVAGLPNRVRKDVFPGAEEFRQQVAERLASFEQ